GDECQFAEFYQAARDGTIGPVKRVLVKILELVRDTQLQKQNERGDKRRQQGRGHGRSVAATQQPREADGGRTECGDQQPMRKNRKPFPLVNAPTVGRDCSGGGVHGRARKLTLRWATRTSRMPEVWVVRFTCRC